MFHAHDNHPADCIKENVLNVYSGGAIYDAKLALWNAYETYLPQSTERSGANQSTRELADILRSVDGIDRLFCNANILPYVFVAVNLRNLPCVHRQDDVIEDILSRLKRLETRDAGAPTTAPIAPRAAPSTTYADAAKSRAKVRTSVFETRRTDTVPPVVSNPQNVRKRRVNEQLLLACDDTCPTPGHVTSSLIAEAMRYDGEGFSISQNMPRRRADVRCEKGAT